MLGDVLRGWISRGASLGCRNLENAQECSEKLGQPNK